MKKILVYYWLLLLFVLPFDVRAGGIGDADLSLRHTWPLFAIVMAILSVLAFWSFAKFWDVINDKPKVKKDKKHWKKKMVA